MKIRHRFTVFLYVFLLLGCQTLAPPTETVKNEGSYNKVIKGALGFNFGVMDTTLLKKKGFKKILNPKYYSDVGKWRSTGDHKDEFFNYNVELVISPFSNIVMSIEGNRLYGKNKYVNHFGSCKDDFRAIITQLKNKYPTLVSGNLGVFKQNEYVTSWYHEAVVNGKYSKEYVGRFVVVKCIIQTWNDETVIGSLLSVSYNEASEITKKLSDEQKKVFIDSSEETLKEKGLGKDRL